MDGISHHDATQGHLGNCWFVAACSVLSGGKEMWTKVIPDAEEQEFSSENYGGIFRFRFWRFGEWIEVCVDDLLPCSEDGDLLFTHSSQHTEFWSALLEKAYAKYDMMHVFFIKFATSIFGTYLPYFFELLFLQLSNSNYNPF